MLFFKKKAVAYVTKAVFI